MIQLTGWLCQDAIENQVGINWNTFRHLYIAQEGDECITTADVIIRTSPPLLLGR